MKRYILIGLLAILLSSCEFMDKDYCMNHGGCWDKVDKVCRHEEPNAQELCNRREKK